MDNRITIENAKTNGLIDRSYWDAAISNQIEGFASDFSVNAGQTVDFKINVNGEEAQTLPYQIEIYRLGYYGGAGARQVADIHNADGAVQAAPLFDPDLGLVDAGNWLVTDQWTIPADAVSGVYLARLQRLDSQGDPIEGATNQIPFIVRNDGIAADIVLQTSDTTWQAYNGWGGNNGQLGPNFYGDPTGVVNPLDPAPTDPGLNNDRAYAVSYNRPFLTRDGGGAASGAQDYLFGADYAAVFWLEQNGYDVSYISGVDTARLGASYLENYQAYISVGHDEYWSGDQRTNVEAARDAGVNLLFWSGNEVYWKTRWDNSISADDTAYRTLVSYKETWANADPNAGTTDYANIDPSNEWTGTWRDMRFAGNPLATGQEPENSLTGQLFGPDGTGQFGGALDITAEQSGLRYWQNTSVASSGGATNLATGLLGYEWDTVPEDGYRPQGEIRLSETTLTWSGILVDQGNTVEPGTATHSLSLYRAESGALVFGAGTVFWSWGLSNEHDSSPYGAEIENSALQQFTVNLFADMGIQPASLGSGLTLATGSTDHTPATAIINDVAESVAALNPVTITGTASDIDGNPSTSDGKVALVELSFDDGATWRVAEGTTNWSYVWRPTTEGNVTILTRAIDDSLNVYNATADTEAVTVTAPTAPGTFSLFDPGSPVSATQNADSPVELGMRFTVDRAGSVTQLRYYRGINDSGDTDTRDGHLWSSDGTLLGTATFNSAPGDSGWQVAPLSIPVSLTAETEYFVSYHTDNNYVATNGFFAAANEVTFDGVDDNAFTGPFGVISAPESSNEKGNGTFTYGSGTLFPTSSFAASNYWVDVTFAPASGTANTMPVITSGNFEAAENQITAGTVTATDADGNEISYALVAGGDAGLFNINASTGVLAFKSAPNFEAPGDAGANNVYDITVSASDGQSLATKAISITVTDVAETVMPSGSTVFGTLAPADWVSASSDPTNYELGTKFLSSQDGTIAALRYYRVAADADDTDVRTLRLWDNTDHTLMGSVQVASGPSQSGWQVGVLAAPVAIAAGHTYVVSYGYSFNNGDGSSESYAATPNYFATSQTGSDSILTAPASAVTNGLGTGGVGNGLFVDGSPGSFPTLSFNASNYWVDVVFQASGGASNSPPQITSSPTFSAAENQTAIGLVVATDLDSDPLTFAIAGGADANLFTIGASSGRLQFKDPQNFEGPDRSFDVTVSLSDGINLDVTQAVTVNLSDVDETAEGPASLNGHQLRADYVFGATSATLYPGAGASQTATVGSGVEFTTLPSSGSDVGNGNFGLASVDAATQTVRIEFPLDSNIFAGRDFVDFAGAENGKPFNGVLLADADALPAIRSVRIIGQEGFTTSTGEYRALTGSDLTVTADGIFLNVAGLGRMVDVDPFSAGTQSAWVELLVELNDAPLVVTAPSGQNASAGSAFSFTVSAEAFSDDDGDTLFYTANKADGSPLPAWLSFNAATRTFSGTPGTGDAGILSVAVTASDETSSTSASFDLTVTDVDRNLLVNGSFEVGPATEQYAALSSGSGAINGWTVTAGSIDYIHNYWDAADGDHSLDMNGSAAGQISQAFATVAGTEYDLSFSLSANPDDHTLHGLIVSAAGEAQDFYAGGPGHDAANMGWSTQHFHFTATASTTTLAFAGLDGGPWGAALDNVSVHELSGPPPPPPDGNLLLNGSFEVGPTTEQYAALSSGSGAINGWTVTAGSIDYIHNYWDAADGDHSLDMNGSAAGEISQAFATVAGTEYDLSFSLSANPDDHTLHGLKVSAAGEAQDFYAGGPGHDAANMGWSTQHFHFTATASTTTLAFAGLDGGPWGAALDNVSVHELSGPPPPPPDGNLLLNGSFEVGPATEQYAALSSGSGAINGWTVTAGSIDYIHNYWDAADGDHSLDMNGSAAGQISQAFATVAGTEYDLSFSLSANPDDHTLHGLKVSAAGEAQDFYAGGPGHDAANMGWSTQHFHFTATASTTTLAFAGLDSGPWGAALDNVSVAVAASSLTFA